jgi:OPA family glycerol-3-phosphate transporter-like MFS transporter
MNISPSSAAAESPSRPAVSLDAARPGEGMILWVIWLTYGSFYFCRQNISAAVPGLQAEGLSRTEIGSILGALKIAYAVGQLVNGQLAERLPARWLLAGGMLGSAALNVAFGLAEGLYFLIFIWACNGYFQALGWTPCVRVAANWVPVSRRGRALGIIGTSYQCMAGVTYLVAGWSAYWLGWRGAMYVPAILLAAAAIHMLVFLRERPDGPEAESVDQGHSAAAIASEQAWLDNVIATLSNPALWVLAISLALLDACRYGFQDWGLAHLQEVQQSHVGITAAKYAILPAGGILGALFGGWATDRFFGGRRAPVICGMLILLGLLTLCYDVIARANEWATVALLCGIGFAIFGPQVLLVGTAPIDLARKGTAAAAAGFVNFMGYLGAFSGDLLTGYLVDRYNWGTAIYFWAGCALAGAGVVATLWYVGPRKPAADRRRDR